MAEGDLCKLNDVKGKAGIALADTSRDAEIKRLITAASNFVRSELQEYVTPTNLDGIYHGNGGTLMVLRERPVLRITKVIVNGEVVPQSKEYGQVGWFLDPSRLGVRLRGMVFKVGVGNVRILHVAGYDPVPAEYAETVAVMCAHRLKEEKRLGVVSQANEGASITFDVSTLPRSVREFLNDPERVPV